MKVRELCEEDHGKVVSVVDRWWGGRRVAGKLPRLFFRYFQDTGFVVEEGGEIVGFLIGFVGSSTEEAKKTGSSSQRRSFEEVHLVKVRSILRLVLAVGILLAVIGVLRQRRHPIPHPPRLTFLFENRLVNGFVGPERLIQRLDLAPGMRVLDAGCGPGRLTIPLARAVGPAGEVVSLDGQHEMLQKLQERLDAEGIRNVRPVRAVLGEGVLNEGGFDRILLAMVLGEARDRGAAARELYAALEPGGVLSVTEIFGDPDYRRPGKVRREIEGAGFRLARRFGGFPAYTLNFEKPL